MPILGTIASSTRQGQATDTGAMFPIFATTVGVSGTASVTFSNIPQTYSHLQLRYSAKNNRNSDYNGWGSLKVNGSYGARFQALLGDASGYLSYSGVPDNGTGYQLCMPGDVAGLFGVGILDFINYTDTNKVKVIKALSGVNNNGSGAISFSSFLQNSTSAITSISIFAVDNTTILQNSSFALYGIKG